MKDSDCTITQRIPIDPMKMVMNLSCEAIGCAHACIRIANPPVPNMTIINNLNPLSLTTFVPPDPTEKSLQTQFREK